MISPENQAKDRRRRARLIAAPADRALRDRVRVVLRDALARGPDATPASLARRLGTSVRTLQRRLEVEGSSLRRIRDELCRERAIERLRDPRVSVACIAAELGFSDTAAFSKAFKRWTRESPSVLRRRENAAKADANR